MVNVDYIAPSRTTTIRIEHRPVYSALESLSSLSIVEQFPGMSAWTLETARSLSEAQRHTHDLVFGPLHDAVFPLDSDNETKSLPAYLETLGASDPAAMRDRLLRQLCRREDSDGERPDPAVLLADRQAYLVHIEYLYQCKDKLDHFDRALYEEAYVLLHDAPAMKQLIVSHLRTMWDEYLAPEWARVEPMLRELSGSFPKARFLRAERP